MKKKNTHVISDGLYEVLLACQRGHPADIRYFCKKHKKELEQLRNRPIELECRDNEEIKFRVIKCKSFKELEERILNDILQERNRKIKTTRNLQMGKA